MPTDDIYNYDENSGSGISEYDNDTLLPEMIGCQCNDTNLMMVERNFLLKWISIAEPHSISKLSTAAHKLKVATDYLEVHK